VWRGTFARESCTGRGGSACPSVVEGTLWSDKSLEAAQAAWKPVRSCPSIPTPRNRTRPLAHTVFPRTHRDRVELRYLSWFQTHTSRPRKCKYSPCSRESTYASCNHIHHGRRRTHLLGGSRRSCRGIHLRTNLPHILYPTQVVTRSSGLGEMDCSTNSGKSGTIALID
jgi:hypothetical protein